MQDCALYAKLLGLEFPWDVVGVDLNIEDRTVLVSVAHVAGEPTRCPECKVSCPKHDTRTRKWRHLDTMQYRTVLTAEVPRVDCPEHGVKQMKVPWAGPKSRFTALFECLVIDWLHDASISAVAAQLGLSWDEVSGIMARAVSRGLARRQLVVPAVIGVDETSFQKRHEYVTVVCDPTGKKVLYVADGRGVSSLAGFFGALTPEQLDGIEVVAMDMSGPFLSATRAALGETADERIVFDKFHIASLLGDAVNTVRRTEHKALLARSDDQLKGTRHLFLTNRNNLSSGQLRSIEAFRKSNLKVARAWAIKETFMDVFAVVRAGDVERQLKKVLGWMARSRLAPMKRAAKTIRRHLDGVINAALSGVTNATSEAINSRIQWLKKQAAGFRNRERFRNAIYFHLGGLDLYPDAVSTHPNS
jgi:transposase